MAVAVAANPAIFVVTNGAARGALLGRAQSTSSGLPACRFCLFPATCGTPRSVLKGVITIKPPAGDAMRNARDKEFQDFVRRRRETLLKTATVMTGGDQHLAEDLVQVCLTKLYLAWPRIRAVKLDGYARRVLVNALIDEKRRRYRRREQVWADVPDRPQSTEINGDRYDLLEALGQLPPGMRAAVVLRHVEGLSTEETADALRCSTGTVKSQTARGLARLRELTSDLNHTHSGDTQ
jgi:RNA polymerase sigma-70 factor (sigma-E family)